MPTQKLNGLDKAAILLISLGPEYSAKIMKHLPDEEIEILSSKIANIIHVDPEVRDKVLQEFLEMCDAQEYIAQGGVKYAKEILEKSLGPARAQEIIRRLTESSRIRPFTKLRKADPKELVNFVVNEHPQTIALILAHLEPQQAAEIMRYLPPEVQAEVSRRIATMERTSPEVLRDIEGILERRVSTIAEQEFTISGGVKSLVDILNRVDRATEKTILERLESEDPELAEEVRKRMFVFEDIITLDDASIRRVLREVDTRDLALALKGTSEEVKERILKNMSQRAAEMLQEDIEFLGPVRLREVEEAQQKIVQVIRKLDEVGEIIISRGGEDAIVV